MYSESTANLCQNFQVFQFKAWSPSLDINLQLVRVWGRSDPSVLGTFLYTSHLGED